MLSLSLLCVVQCGGVLIGTFAALFCVCERKDIMNVVHSLTELVGRTPLLRLERFAPEANIYGKCECFNPAGSAKDRVALKMLLTAEEQGLLAPGGTIIEPTSGNTGIGLAAYGVSRGYRVILTMPASMSRERIALLKAYGAQVILTDAAGGMAAAIAKAEELRDATPNSFIAGQFDNPANPQAHYETTGPEIWEALDGQVDIFVAGVGTGGTLSGTGRYLKEKNPHVRIVAVEPASSPLISQGKAGPHGLQGIGANFIPRNFDAAVADEIITVTEEEAYAAGRCLARTEGLLCGITSGAALHAAMVLAAREENKGKHIVTLLPDSGERYLSTPLFMED